MVKPIKARNRFKPRVYLSMEHIRAVKGYLDMALTKNIVRREDIPHEPGEWIEFRLLGWLDLEQARKSRSTTALESLRETADLIPVFRKMREDDDSPRVERVSVPEDEYDRMTMLELSIKAWSYPEEISADVIGTLDEMTMKWAFNKIVELSVTKNEVEIKNSLNGFSTFLSGEEVRPLHGNSD